MLQQYKPHQQTFPTIQEQLMAHTIKEPFTGAILPNSFTFHPVHPGEAPNLREELAKHHFGPAHRAQDAMPAHYGEASTIQYCTHCPAKLRSRGQNPTTGYILILSPPGDHLVEICYLPQDDDWAPVTADRFYSGTGEVTTHP